MQRPEGVAVGDGDDGPVDRGRELPCPHIDVDRRLRRNAVALLGDSCEQFRQRPRVLGPRLPYFKRRHDRVLVLLLAV